jgi:phosphoribosylformylglycinamidine cyclo-ligase
MADAYSSRGASSTKDEVRSIVSDLDKGEFAGTFCKIIADPFGVEEGNSLTGGNSLAVMHSDGAGTKSALAYIKYKEFGDFTAFEDIAQDSIVMNLDDLLCVGATDRFIMSNTIDRNAHRVDGQALKSVIGGYVKFIRKMAGYGVYITMSGGETADVGDLASTLIVNSTFYTRLNQSDVIDCANIEAGDVIVGFSSFGQATYEDKYNAGMGSNGLTAARHILLSDYYADKYPETYSDTIDKSKVYCGRYRFEDKLPGTQISIGDAMLSPTRTYAPVIRDIFNAAELGRGKIHGLIHCTGGGQTKCRGFGRNLRFVKDSLLTIPPLFKAIYDSGEITAKEMYQTFNMGHRLELFCDPSDAEKFIAAADRYNIEAKIVGYVEKSANMINSVTIKDELTGSAFEY